MMNGVASLQFPKSDGSTNFMCIHLAGLIHKDVCCVSFSTVYHVLCEEQDFVLHQGLIG